MARSLAGSMSLASRRRPDRYNVTRITDTYAPLYLSDTTVHYAPDAPWQPSGESFLMPSRSDRNPSQRLDILSPTAWCSIMLVGLTAYRGNQDESFGLFEPPAASTVVPTIVVEHAHPGDAPSWHMLVAAA